IHSNQMSDWYNNNLIRCTKSKAYALFCEKVFGKNLSQFNVLDMDQLETLISTLSLNVNDLVLDLGCGLGKITEYIQMKTGAKITGIDFAEHLIQWAKDNIEATDNTLEFQVGNINELVFPASSFDAIYAIDTLYPTNVDDLEVTIAKLKELVKPNGQLGIFFAQIIESKEQQHFLEPNQTKMALALKNNRLSFTVIDFTQNARDIWEREITIGNNLREMFEKEGNLDLCEDRIADGKRCVYRIDNQLQKRYFYHVSR
ncbi:MAG: class I SAM-dependent methyltransferase, partial [Candidatus Hodarchaeales archaeon]